MYLIDTNVLSELRRAHRAEPRVLAWSKTTTAPEVFISAVTVFEIEYGILRLTRKDPVQAAMFARWLHDEVLREFDGRILPFDANVALRCAALHVPDPKPERDSFIAATALVHDLTVVTRNIADFAPMGVRLIDPWQPAA